MPFAALMCHEPVVLPALGGGASPRTTLAMAEASRALVALGPDVVLVISPRAPRIPRFCLAAEPWLRGDLRAFAAPGVEVMLPSSPSAVARLLAVARARHLPLEAATLGPLDHGALVPLRFLVDAGWRGATLLLALPAQPDRASARAMGQAIAAAAAGSGTRWAVVASGELGARAGGFDGASICARMDEDASDALEIAAAAVGWDARGHRVLSYEGSLLVAILHNANPPIDPVSEDEALLAVAREAVLAATAGLPYEPPPVPVRRPRPHGLFVTLLAPSGELRGCIGHLGAVTGRLERAVARCAGDAASSDPRFAPVQRGEVESLTIEIALLEAPERAAARALDPRRFGVVVRQGDREGVLLPGLPAIDRAAQQIDLACHKGGLDPARPFEIYRFVVHRVADPCRSPAGRSH